MYTYCIPYTCSSYYMLLSEVTSVCVCYLCINNVPYSWAFYPGGAIEYYCSSSGNSLHFNGQLAQSSLTTLDIYISSDTFVQFDLITSCSDSTSDLFYIELEYSTNGGLTWSVVETNCQTDCENRGL